jgi:hypothetical protein
LATASISLPGLRRDRFRAGVSISRPFLGRRRDMREETHKRLRDSNHFVPWTVVSRINQDQRDAEQHTHSRVCCPVSRPSRSLGGTGKREARSRLLCETTGGALSPGGGLELSALSGDWRSHPSATFVIIRKNRARVGSPSRSRRHLLRELSTRSPARLDQRTYGGQR